MNSDLLASVVYLLSAVPTYPSHDHLDVTVYENGFATSCLLATPVLSDSGLSEAPVYPGLFVAIRSVLVNAAIRWPSVIPTHQIVDSLQDALFILERCQAVFCRSEHALLVSAHTAQGVISSCHLHNDSIPWVILMDFDAQTKPMARFTNVTADPLERFLNLEAFQMYDTATYEPMAQPHDLANEYDGPLFDDWSPHAYPTNCEPSSSTAEPHHNLHDHTHYLPIPTHSPPSGTYLVEYNALDTLSRDISDTLGEPSFTLFPERLEITVIASYEDSSSFPSPSSTRSSPFPETPAFDNFRSELPHITSSMPTVAGDVTTQEEQNTDKVTQIVYPTYPTFPASVAALSPLSECESLPSSRCSSATPSSQSSECSSTSSTSNEEILQLPVKVAGKKIRRTKAGGVKKKTKSKEKHPCGHCELSFTRDHDAERHQSTCKYNPNRSQKEQCKVCTKALPVRLDAKRRHWGTLECSDAARKRGFTRMDEESYELL